MPIVPDIPLHGVYFGFAKPGTERKEIPSFEIYMNPEKKVTKTDKAYNNHYTRFHFI